MGSAAKPLTPLPGGSITAFNIDEKDLEQGVPGLAVAVVEEVRDTLKAQAFKVMDSGVLNDGRRVRLGRALLEMEAALEEIKAERGVAGSVRMVRDGLDGLVGDMVDQILHPETSF
jgi:hypothetical protein